MADQQSCPKTLEEVHQFVETADRPGQWRNGRPAIERICAMAGMAPAQVPTDAGQMGLYAPPREAGIHQKAARVRLHVGRVARASARKNA